jgi:hypothetical protein
MTGAPHKNATTTFDRRLRNPAELLLRRHQEPGGCKRVVSTERDPENVVDINYNVCEAELHLETEPNTLASTARPVGGSAVTARRQP